MAIVFLIPKDCGESKSGLRDRKEKSAGSRYNSDKNLILDKRGVMIWMGLLVAHSRCFDVLPTVYFLVKTVGKQGRVK
ncbi:MAG: hypothetical protein HKUEN01_10600 [Candidatus Kuenenia stuttgartiensis]|nr:MAG: hypothetical protein HKUEN01_10600 [Candidatus Kuenenia stuttgartiensis]